MEAATATLHHSFGLGPHGPNPPHGAPLAQGSHQPGQGPSGLSRPEEHHHHQQQQQQQQQQQPHNHHHKPFFYIQPSQPCLPMQNLQWPVPMPMPVSYNPYYGYPGLGYSMPVMPQFQPNPYMEPPGFIVPHTHLHLMDYRRMLNPQYYQTMAYHARRFRYQHNTPGREMTSSEVQTEPLSGTQRTSTPGTSNVEASSVLPVHGNSSDTPSVPSSQLLSPALAMQKGDHSLELTDIAPPSTTRTPPNGSFVIQTEEVRIECCTTPVGLQVLHSHETAEVSHRFSQDVVQCSSVLQGRMLQDDDLCLPADKSEQPLKACPDILLVRTPSSDEKIPELEESRNRMHPVTVNSKLGSQVASQGDIEETKSEEDLTSNNFQFKVVHLPFDPNYLEELRKMESTVWSLDETLLPSAESLIQNGFTESYDETLAEVPSDALLMREDPSTEEVVPVIEMPSPAEDELGDSVPTMEGLGDEVMSEADMGLMMDVPAEEEAPEAKVTLSPNLLLLDNSPLNADLDQHRPKRHIQDHQDTSFESLPAYLPSTSWLADFDNIYHYNNIPPTPKKRNKSLSRCGLDVPTRRRKLEYKEPPVRKPRERYIPKTKVDRRSLSDHECCLSRNFNENAFNPYALRKEQLCSRCQTKRQICTSASRGLDGRILKRKAVPIQQWNDHLLPTCEACKSHSKKRLMRKCSSPDVHGPQHGHDTEGESSENGSCHTRLKWRVTEDPRRPNDLKKPLASKQNLEKCPVVTYPKLKEKNCVCNELQHQPVVWERLHHCPHGNSIREMDENSTMPVSPQDKRRNMDQIYLTHNWQTEKSWKAVIPNPDISKNEARSQHLNKHKTSQPQSQGTRRKDTRC